MALKELTNKPSAVSCSLLRETYHVLHGHEKSDLAIVAVKPTNKAE